MAPRITRLAAVIIINILTYISIAFPTLCIAETYRPLVAVSERWAGRCRSRYARLGPRLYTDVPYGYLDACYRLEEKIFLSWLFFAIGLLTAVLTVVVDYFFGDSLASCLSRFTGTAISPATMVCQYFKNGLFSLLDCVKRIRNSNAGADNATLQRELKRAIERIETLEEREKERAIEERAMSLLPSESHCGVH